MSSSAEPRATIRTLPEGVEAVFSGQWTSAASDQIENAAEELLAAAQAAGRVRFNLSGITRLDTAGALVIDRSRLSLEQARIPVELTGAEAKHKILIDEVLARGFKPLPERRPGTIVDFFAEIGEGVVSAGRDFREGVSFLGEFMLALGRSVLKPWKFRWAALFKQIEVFAFRSVPIIVLISFLVGAIIAQQSIFQLQYFGTTAFVADLLGILILRELGVLLTSIMIAGRSGSAITAELGSMKMREEIDALRTMGLDPMEVLVVPRIMALIIGLPMLAFISDMAALFGGGLVAWIYGDISPDVFLSRLQNAIKLNTFLVGIIKAPFMGLVIGLIATLEGLAVQGSAESLGRQTTASVVKAIFMVIVVDGLFAMFFAAIRY